MLEFEASLPTSIAALLRDLFRRKNQTSAAIMARPATPPTTPPAIAPVFDEVDDSV